MLAQDVKMKMLKIQKRRTDVVVTIPSEMYSVIEGAEYMKCKEDGHGNIVLTPVVD